jgi:hypothetical protein
VDILQICPDSYGISEDISAHVRNISELWQSVRDCMTFFKYIRDIGQYRIIQKRIDYFKFLVSKANDDIKDSFVRAELLVHLRKTSEMPESEVTIDREFRDDMPVDGHW